MGVQRIRIVIPKKPEEFKAMEEIQKDAWNAEDIAVTPAHVLRAAQMANNCVYIAYCGDEPAGYVYGFFGLHNSKLFLHSHQVGVKRKYQNRGVGYLLKLRQRDFAMRLGIDLIRWTFDPLQSKNAYFNFTKLGVINREYIRNLYGEIRDELNKGLPTDRFYVEWYISSPRVVDRVEKGVKPPLADDLELTVINKIKTLEQGLITIADYDTSLREKILAMEIPTNFTDIKKRAPNLALEWRIKTREIFEKYLSSGYLVADLIHSKDKKRCFYVLVRDTIDVVLKKNWWELL